MITVNPHGLHVYEAVRSTHTQLMQIYTAFPMYTLIRNWRIDVDERGRNPLIVFHRLLPR